MSYEFCSKKLFLLLWEISHFCISEIVFVSVLHLFVLIWEMSVVRCTGQTGLVVVKDHVKRMIKQPRDPCQRAQDNL